jgi:hypothetical protein
MFGSGFINWAQAFLGLDAYLVKLGLGFGILLN